MLITSPRAIRDPAAEYELCEQHTGFPSATLPLVMRLRPFGQLFQLENAARTANLLRRPLWRNVGRTRSVTFFTYHLRPRRC